MSRSVSNNKLGGNYGNLRHQESDELQDTRNLRDEDLRTLAQVRSFFQHPFVRYDVMQHVT